MSQAFTSNNQHVVFSTKERRPMIALAKQPKLWAYVGGIIRNIGGMPMAIGGVSDHIHVLAALPPDLDVAKFVSTIKANSSRWMGPEFVWQRGYGAFSVSTSNLDAVTDYIERQSAHHAKRDFESEFIGLLKKHNVPFDPRYVFA